MRFRYQYNRVLFILFSAFLFVAGASQAQSVSVEWPQWGGPLRNFTASVKGLANSWPPSGPRQLWSRDLGDGYSSIAADGGRLFTLYRLPARVWQFGKVDQDVIIALDANTGKTIWEHKFDAPHAPKMQMENGPGPHSTPLIVGNHLYAVGVMANLYCLDKNTGSVVWSHDLYKEFNAPVRGRGWSSSPISYKNSIILPLGGPGQALIAFDQKTGAVIWKNGDPDWGSSSPILIHVDGQDQMVNFGAAVIFGADPNNGTVLWTHPHRTDYGLNICTPVWCPDNILFISSAYSGGSRALQLSQKGGKTAVRQLWFNNRMRVHFGNAIRIGDFVYGSSGDFGPAFLTAIHVKTGEIAFQDRSFQKASMIYVDDKLILIDEDGNLGLVTVSPEGLKVLSKASVFNGRAWTGPTLVGSRLYVRDRMSIKAFDLR